MNRILLSVGGLLNLSLALFKIAMPYLFHWREALGSSKEGMWAILNGENLAFRCSYCPLPTCPSSNSGNWSRLVWGNWYWFR